MRLLVTLESPIPIRRMRQSIIARKESGYAAMFTRTSIEGVWSLFKQSIVGSYHQISTKHMDAYLDEFEWGFNQRDNQYLFRDTMLRLLSSPKMEQELIEKSA